MARKIYLEDIPLDEAWAAFTEALRIAREQDARSWELRAATSLAALWVSRDRSRDARELIVPVYEWFSEGLDTTDLIAARALVEDLS